MILLLVVVIAIIFIILNHFFEYEEWVDVSSAFAFVILIPIIIVLVVAVIINLRIPEKLAIYEIENKEIEQGIQEIVLSFREHEKDTFEKTSDITTYLITYPELKSDSLVVEQMKVYVENKNTIKDLKIREINLKTYKWLLYFGG